MSENPLAEYDELVGILNEMDLPTERLNLLDEKNIPWLREHINLDQGEKAQRALELLKKSDPNAEGYYPCKSPVWQNILRVHDIRKEEFVENYAKKGVEVISKVGSPLEPLKIYAVRLNFTPEEWAELVNKYGKYLPACCAEISEIRSILVSAMIEDGEITATDLQDAVELIVNHGHDGLQEENHPIARLVALWNLIKDDASLNLSGVPVDPNSLDGAFGVLCRASAGIRWTSLFGQPDEHAELHAKMQTYEEFIRIVPAIRTVFTELVEKGVEPFEGWAVSTGDQILRRRGLSIFATRKRAKEVAKLFNSEGDIKFKYTVRKVRVSLDGVEFLS